MSGDQWAELRDAMIGCGAESALAESAVSKIGEHLSQYEGVVSLNRREVEAKRVKSDSAARTELQQAASHAEALSRILRNLSPEGYYWYHQACGPLTEGQTGDEVEIVKDEISLHIFLAKTALQGAAESIIVRNHRRPNLDVQCLVLKCCREWFLATKAWPVSTMDDGKLLCPLYRFLASVAKPLSAKQFLVGLRAAKSFAESDSNDPAHAAAMALKRKKVRKGHKPTAAR